MTQECTSVIKGQAVSMYMEECVKRVRMNRLRMEEASIKAHRVGLLLLRQNVEYGALKFEDMVAARLKRCS